MGNDTKQFYTESFKENGKINPDKFHENYLIFDFEHNEIQKYSEGQLDKNFKDLNNSKLNDIKGKLAKLAKNSDVVIINCSNSNEINEILSGKLPMIYAL